MSDDVVLRISNLRVETRSNVLLDDVSVELRRGEVLGIIGESGAGKSTLALASIGLLRAGCAATAGSVEMCGHDVLCLSRPELETVRRNHSSYVAQSAAAAFNPFYRLEDQVTELAAMAGKTSPAARRRIAAELFAELQLPDPESFGKRYPHQVSGGQLQRAMIAMALVNRPYLIIFDEPTTALDVTTQIEVLRLIRKIMRDHECAALYVSHDLAVVAQMADRVLVMRQGKMVEQGETRELVVHPSTDYAGRLVAKHGDGSYAQAPARTDRVLEVRDLSAAYGAKIAMQDVSFTLETGQVMGLVGESGSGKTTVARVVAGLQPKRSGDILLDNERLAPLVEDRSFDVRRRIQYIHQLPDLALNPRHTIREIIGRPLAFFHGLKGSAAEPRLRELSEAIEMPDSYLARYPSSLSGGQKQRVCIARSLAADPDILICDEITSALDPLVEESIVQLLLRLMDERKLSLLFITHNLGLTKRFAHKVAVMQAGRLVEQNDTKAIFEAPEKDYTRMLIAAAPSIEPGWLDRVA